MRILEEQTQEEQIKVCDNCRCRFAYSPKDDTYAGFEGLYVDCPKCNQSIILKKFDRPAQFPESYYYFGNGVHIKPEDIEEWVKRGIKHCIYKNEDNYYIGTGDSWVEIKYFEEDDTFNIHVSQGYYDKDISREEAKKLIEY